MRSTLTFVLALLLCGALAGCSDDSESPPPGSDGQVSKDTGATQDTGVNGDAPVTTQDQGTTQSDQGTTQQDQGTTQQDVGTTKWDGLTKKLSCGEIGLCSDACGKTCTGAIKFACLMQCQTDCKAKGSASALTLFNPLSTCITAKCLTACINGPSAGCTTCVTTKCKTETDNCNAHKC